MQSLRTVKRKLAFEGVCIIRIGQDHTNIAAILLGKWAPKFFLYQVNQKGEYRDHQHMHKKYRRQRREPRWLG